jgi:hypothetical protein
MPDDMPAQCNENHARMGDRHGDMMQSSGTGMRMMGSM